MVGEYVRVKKDIVVIRDTCSFLPGVGGARRTWSYLQQAKIICVFHRLTVEFEVVWVTSSLGDSLPKESVSSPPLIGLPAWLAGRVGIDIDRS